MEQLRGRREASALAYYTRRRGGRGRASGGDLGQLLDKLLANSKKGLIFAAQTGQEAAHERLKS